MFEIKINKNSRTPIYLQVVSRVEQAVLNGELSAGDRLPSLNALVKSTGIGKDTANKSYSVLMKRRLINSRHGKGFFISDSFGGRRRILLLIDKLSVHQQRMISAFCDRLGDSAEITLLMHNQNLELFEDYVLDNLGSYDYYVVVPHFETDSTSVRKVASLLRKIPEKKLVVMDHIPEGLDGGYGAAYQDISEDIPHALSQGREVLETYKRMRVVKMSQGLYFGLTWQSVKSYCDSIGIPSQVEYGLPEDIMVGDVFFLTGSLLDHLLVDLSNKIALKGFKLGRDVGLICLNDFSINDIVLGGLSTISSDYAEIGISAAEMILNETLEKIHCKCNLVRRSTF